MPKKRKEYQVTTGNIFADLGLDAPNELMARAKLLHKVNSLIKASGLSQRQVAEKLGITQREVTLLVSGRLSAFSADTALLFAKAFFP